MTRFLCLVLFGTMFNVHLCLLLADLQAYLLSVFVKAGCLLLDVLLSEGD